MEILDELKKDTIQSLVSAGKRADDRDFESYRDIFIKKNVLEFSEGSALVRIGNSQVLCAVKLGMATPYPDREDEGMLVTSAELMPMASYLFESGPPTDEAVELARVVDRGIRAAEMIDMKKLFVEEGKVLSIYLDISYFEGMGNMKIICLNMC